MKKFSLFLLVLFMGTGLLTFSAMKHKHDKFKAKKMVTQSVKMDPKTGTITTVQVLASKEKSEEGEASAVATELQHSILLMDTPEGEGIIAWSSTPELALYGGELVEPTDPAFDENNFVCYKRVNGVWETAECWWILAYFE